MTATPGTGEVHVCLRFPGGMILNYRAERAIAERLAANLRPHCIEVIIDGLATDPFPPLPCAELWTD